MFAVRSFCVHVQNRTVLLSWFFKNWGFVVVVLEKQSGTPDGFLSQLTYDCNPLLFPDLAFKGNCVHRSNTSNWAGKCDLDWSLLFCLRGCRTGYSWRQRAETYVVWQLTLDFAHSFQYFLQCMVGMEFLIPKTTTALWNFITRQELVTKTTGVQFKIRIASVRLLLWLAFPHIIAC